jgi:ribosome-binding protein aMBF1 (putative translation factor)
MKMIRLTQERERRRWTKTKLAFLMEIHPATMGKIESGTIPAFPAYRQKLEKIFGISANELFQEVEVVAQ